MYSWAPGVIAFITSKGCLQVRDCERDSLVQIENPETDGITSLLCDSLREPTSLDDLLRLAPPAHHLALHRTLGQLSSLGLVVSDPQPTIREKSEYQIQIVGETGLGTALEEALATSGLRAERNVSGEDWAHKPSQNGHGPEKGHVRGRIGSDGRTFVIAAATENEFTLCRRVARECAAKGTPWAVFRYVERRFEVGPIIIPGETACFDCMTLRRLGAVQDYTSEYEFLQYLSDPSRPRIISNPPSGLTQLAASVLASELGSFCLDGGVSGICNGLWLISLRPLRIKLHRLLKIPGCSTCELGLARLKGLASN